MRILISAILLLISYYGYNQDKFLPSIKQGSKLHYMVFTGGQDLPILITVDSLGSDYIKMGWTIEGLGNGGWVMKKKSIEGATKGVWEEPISGSDMELADDKAVLLFSKAQWASIQKDKKADFDAQTFFVKDPTEKQQLKLAGKVADAILLEGQNGSTRVWILNSSSLPILIKIEGNTMGPDLELRSID